ncbi:MAG TPA: DUF4157 domain-containing protein, partial [Actinomycetota bacterium]|nr:DUF4157 domain-containing protein [Actinomycetota bacterium]
MEQDRSPERDRDVAAAGAGRAAPSRVRPVLSNRALARQAAAGRRLPPDVGAEMSRALDADVDDVRIHTDTSADRAARALGARAFTTGADVFFREGAYAPETPRGRETLAHELRHATAGTMAGQATPSIVDPATPTVSDPAGPTEAEAGAVGRAVAAGETVPASALASRPPDAAVHRQPPEEGPRVPMQGGRPVFPPDVIADMTPRQRVDALLREQDFFVRYRRLDDVMVHGDYTEATLDERVWMIRVVQAAGPSWPYRPAPGDRAIADTAAIEVMLWKSFGGDLLNVAADNLEMFRGSYGRGRVSQVDVVAAIGTAWEQDVKAVARSYLDKNSSIVLGELETIGEAQAARQTKAPISDVTSERDLAIAETQAAAKKVIQAQKALDDLLEVPVGYQELKWQDPQAAPMRLAQKFDPEKPPEINYAGPAMGHWSMGSEAMPEAHFIDWFPGKDKAPPPGDFQGEPFTILAYDGVKHAHDMLRQEVAGFMAQYPAVFAAAQADKLDDLAKASPQDARAMVGTMLHAILDNINKTYPKLVPGENLWLKMKPIHDQLLKGMVTAPSGTKWDDPVRAAVAETIVKEFERAEFWKDLGLATLAAAAFVIAEFATGGLATFFVAAGIGIGAYQAYEKWDEYYTLSHAVGSAATEETQLVYPGQARAAFIGAVLDTVFAILNVAGPAVQWAKASRAGLVGSMVTAGTEAAEITGLETLSRRFAAREIGRKEAGQLVERSVTELGVGETARRTGLQPKDLLAYVDEQSDVGKRISAYAKAPEELPAGAAGTRVKGGYKGTPGRKAVAAATDDYPEGLVHYGLDESGANASYAKSIFEDPEREAGIWVDLDSGEHLAVQGSPDMVEGVGKEGKGWMNDPEFAGRRWHLKEHYHPTKGDGWQISRYPSPDDYEMLLLPYWGRTPPVEPPGPISSIIRWHPPKTGAKPEFTSFGYEPGVDPPFWVEFKDAKTGMIRRERIAPNARGMPDYRPWLDREAKSLNIEIDWSEHAESALGRPPAGAAALKTTTAKAGELAQTLKELATLEPAQAEAVLSGAIEELGPAEALRLVDMDWKKLAETLPKPSAAGEKLRIWRDSVVGGEIRGLLTEEQAVRTGTIGRFENDFDWN